MSVLLPRKVLFHGTFGFVPIALAANNKEAIKSSMVTESFFCGLGFQRGFYKIKNNCIKLDIIQKYKLI